MYKLHLNEIYLNTYIGIYEFEKNVSQKIRIDLIIEFLNIPQSCFNDSIDDTVCYEKINDILIKTSQHKHYKLIEHLAQSLLDTLVLNLNINVNIYLKLKKNIHFIKNIKEAVFYVEHICKK